MSISTHYTFLLLALDSQELRRSVCSPTSGWQAKWGSAREPQQVLKRIPGEWWWVCSCFWSSGPYSREEPRGSSGHSPVPSCATFFRPPWPPFSSWNKSISSLVITFSKCCFPYLEYYIPLTPPLVFQYKLYFFEGIFLNCLILEDPSRSSY